MTDAATQGAVADPADPRLPLRATGLLGEFARAGVLEAADVHVAARLGALAGERDPRVDLAVAFAVRAVRQGSVCVDLATVRSTVVLDPPAGDAGDAGDAGVAGVADDVLARLPWPDPATWPAVVAGGRAVAVGGDGAAPGPRPVRLVGPRLYLDRYWDDEQVVRREITRRAAVPAGPLAPQVAALLAAAFAHDGSASQLVAARRAVTASLTVLTGGPGTGKTHAIAGIVAAVLHAPGPAARVALAAPTGKAAARLTAAVRGAAAESWARPVQDQLRTMQATTVHRLLGPRPGSRSRFRHGPDDRVPYDVVVVDETSMVSLPLMARILESLRPDARLLLVGDPDQLASVEAGAVLRDVVDLGARSGLDPVRRLDHNFRAGSADLEAAARAVRAGDADTLLATAGGSVTVLLADAAAAPEDSLGAVRRRIVAGHRAVVAAAAAGDDDTALAGAAAHRVLTARRTGSYGVGRWAERIEQWLIADGVLAVHPGWPRPSWPLGTPLVVTANDPDNGLVNGETGVVVADMGGGVTAAFGEPGRSRRVHPDRVAALAVAHALTVHKAQGSEFDAVTVILPSAGSPLLTRELLYTALTRARTSVVVVGTEDALREAVSRLVHRASGLAEDGTDDALIRG